MSKCPPAFDSQGRLIHHRVARHTARARQAHPPLLLRPAVEESYAITFTSFSEQFLRASTSGVCRKRTIMKGRPTLYYMQWRPPFPGACSGPTPESRTCWLCWQRFQKRGLNTTILRGARPNTHRSWLGVAGRPSRRPGKPWDTVGPRHAHPPLPLQLLVGSVAKLSGMDRGSCSARVQDRRISPRLSWQISKGAPESLLSPLATDE